MAGSVVAATGVGTGTTAMTCTKPAGTASGDVMVAFQAGDFATLAAMTGPSGWTLVNSLDAGSNSIHVKIWTKTAGASEPTSYTFNQGSNSDGTLIIVTTRGTTAPDSTTSALTLAAAGAACVAPSLSGITTDAVLLAGAALEYASSTTITWGTPPSGMTTQQSSQSQGWTSTTVASQLNPPSPTGTKTFTPSSGSGGPGSISFSVLVPSATKNASGSATATMRLVASASGAKNASGSATASALMLAASAVGQKNASGSISASPLLLAASAVGSRATGGSPNVATMILAASAVGQKINAVFAVLRLTAALTATGRPGAGSATATLRLAASATADPRNAANSASADPLRLAASVQGAGGHLGAPPAGLLRLAASAVGVMQAQGSPAATLRLSASATGVHAGQSTATAALRLVAATSGNTRITTGVTVTATVRLLATTTATSTRQRAVGPAQLRLFAFVEGHRVITAIARQVLVQPAYTTTYELVCVARVQQPSGPPVFLQVDPIDWTGLSYTEELSKPPQLNIGCQITGLTEPILQRLRKPSELPSELWLYRNGRLVFSGPLVTAQVQDESLTLNAQGALGYLRMMTVDSDTVFSNVDQFAIVTSLIDAWQNDPYGNFGIDTSGIAPSGVTRDATYLAKELHNVGQRVEELGLRENGFDIWVDPASRKLQLAYPQRGVDRSTGEDAIVFDERNITSPNILFSVAPGDVASEAFGTGTGNQTIYSAKSNPDVRAQYGRSSVTQSFDGVSEQATLDDHVQGLLDARSTALLVPGPDVRVTPDSDISTYDVGDTVSYTMHNLLSAAGAFRLRKRTVTVSKTGQEAVSVAFV